MMKSTYGTGCFALLNTGERPFRSQHRLLTTVAYQIAGKRTFALEGAIFIAGAVRPVAARRAEDHPRRRGGGAGGETQPLAEAADAGQDVVLVPAFTGLGAPYWNPDCRGAIFGLTRTRGRRIRPGRARKRGLPDLGPFSRPCARTGRISVRPTCCASMAG